MAIIEIERTVSLDGTVQTVPIGPLYAGEDDAHKFIISATKYGADFSLSGNVSAKFIREADGETIPMTGSTSNGKVTLTLIENCYYQPGRFTLTIYLTGGGVKTVVYACKGNVHRTETASVLDPSGEIQDDVTDLLDAISTAQGTIPASYANMQAAIAPTFSSSTSYGAGQYVWNGGELYRFKTAHSGSWASGDAEKVPVSTPLRTAWALESGDAPTLANGTNIDNLIMPGTYKVTNSESSDASLMTGTPPTTELGYRLIVMETSQDNRVWQLAFVSGNYQPRIRYYNGSTWSDWHFLVYRDSPAFTGNPTAPTQNANDNSTKLATTAYADRAAGNAIIAGIPVDSDYVTALASGTDLDTLYTPGSYKVSSPSSMEHSMEDEGTTLPETVNPYRMIVMETDRNTNVYQIVMVNGDFMPRWRRYNGTKWTAWHFFAATDSPAFTGNPTAPTQDEKDNSTKIATTAYADRAAANSSAADSIRGMIGVEHDLVDYGYYNDTKESDPSGAEWKWIGYEKTGTQIKLNGTSAGPFWIKVSGTAISRMTGYYGSDNWTTGDVTFTSGHTYKVSAVLISGSVSLGTGVSEYPSVFAVGASAHNSVGIKTRDNLSTYRVFTSDGSALNIGLYLYGVTTLTNAVYQIVIEDITDSVDAASVRDLVGIQHKMIDYGYGNQVVQGNPDASSPNLDQRISVHKTGTQVWLDGTSAGVMWIRVSGSVDKKTGTRGAASWTDGTVGLVAGRTYKVSATLISGSVSISSGVTNYPCAFAVEPGNYNSIGQRVFDGFNSVRTFDAGNDDINIGLYLFGATTFTNAVYQIVLEEASGDEPEPESASEKETDNLFDITKIPSSYVNLADNVVSGKASQLEGVVLLDNLTTAAGTDYLFNFEFDCKCGANQTAGPSIVAVDAYGDPVNITPDKTGVAVTSAEISYYRQYGHNSFTLKVDSSATALVFGVSGEPSASRVFYFKNIKITRLPKGTVRLMPDYYPHMSVEDYVARNEMQYAGYVHDGGFLRMASAPDPIPATSVAADQATPTYDDYPEEYPYCGTDELPYSYTKFITSTWDTFLPDNYAPTGADKAYDSSRTKIPNVFVQRETQWTSTAYGSNTDTYPIYRYTFTPQTGYEKTVFLSAGCHGNEAEGYWSLYRVMRMIYFEGYKYPTLRNLRNVRFIIIPIWNPWGMQHYRRFNAFEDVDYQAWRWLYDDDHSVEVNGVTYPISSIGEANSIYQTVQEYGKAIDLWIDFHTDPYRGRTTPTDESPQRIDEPRGNLDSSTYGPWGTAPINSLEYVRTLDVICDFYRIIKDEYGFANAKWNISAIEPGGGSFSRWRGTLGFRCGMLEFCTFMQNFPNAETNSQYKSGSANLMKLVQEYYANCLAELLR